MSIKRQFNFAGTWPEEINQKIVRNVLNSVKNDTRVRLPLGEVTIKLVDDAGITALNKQYTGNDYVTDVLTFTYDRSFHPDAEKELGDIAVSLPAAERQAVQAGTDITTEIALLSLHGVLHIAGFNHETPEGQAKMNFVQSTILNRHKLVYREFGWQKDE